MRTWIATNASALRAFLASLDTPISLATWLLIENGEWDQLSLRWLDPQHYPEGIFSALKYRKDVQAVDLLRKAPLPTSHSRRDAALAAWEDAETQCFITNEFILGLRSASSANKQDRDSLLKFLSKVQKRLRRWLGPLPDDLEGGFGPGTCVEYQGKDPTVVDKLWLTPTTTRAAHQLFNWSFDRTLWGRQRHACRLPLPGISRGNRLTTVPKDGRTDRPISIEPLGNLWLQLGIGRILKRKIASLGLPVFKPVRRALFPSWTFSDIDAQEVHRRFLYRCGPEGFSTIDLSSASDTVATELVRAVLPPDWFELLDDCRSKLTLVPSDVKGGRWRHLEKFSSMGNGFTFELETLIFCALLSVGCDLIPGHDLLVFGDDIIVPENCFDLACNVLRTFGFTPNLRKSYRTTPFFESCGGNVHSGVDVTPVRIKGPVDSAAAVIALHNAWRRHGADRYACSLLLNTLPRKLRVSGPEWLGDVVLHGRPYKPIRREGFCPQIKWVRTLLETPSFPIPLERWSPELSVVALLLGSGTRVVRRKGGITPTLGWASIS